FELVSIDLMLLIGTMQQGTRGKLVAAGDLGHHSLGLAPGDAVSALSDFDFLRIISEFGCFGAREIGGGRCTCRRSRSDGACSCAHHLVPICHRTGSGRSLGGQQLAGYDSSLCVLSFQFALSINKSFSVRDTPV